MDEELDLELLPDEYVDNELESNIFHNPITSEFQFYRTIDKPSSPYFLEHGIDFIKNTEFHRKSVSQYQNQDPNGPPPLHGVEYIIVRNFPDYIHVLNEYIRPAPTTEAVFSDFNYAQYSTEPIIGIRKDNVLKLVDQILAINSYDPVHFCDTRFYPIDYSKRADYNCNHNLKYIAYAKRYHPVFADPSRPTTKGWFANVTYHFHRKIVHHIKMTGYPFDNPNDNTEARMKEFYLTNPTEMLTRLHISKKEKPKVRPVYNVPILFLTIERMLTYPMLAQARRKECPIMYGLETIRGGMQEINTIAQDYQTYLMIDWSRFDHTIPFHIIDLFYQDYLRSKVRIDHGYARINHYRVHDNKFRTNNDPKLPDHELSEDGKRIFGLKISNLINFLNNWFKSMIYISPDGYGFRRLYAGVPSGALCTQFIDSFANIIVMIDAMLEFGFTPDFILSNVRLFIMGDDNVSFWKCDAETVSAFFCFFIDYADSRFHMIVNSDKSSISMSTLDIEILGYHNLSGYPIKDINKLIAQLALPERHVSTEDMVVRAIGMAYAAAGCSEDFHNLCYLVFRYYIEKADPNKLQLKSKYSKALPGVFYFYADALNDIDFTYFPDIRKVREIVSFHHGYLTEYPYWNSNYFLDPPDPERSRTTTLSQLNVNKAVFQDAVSH